MLGAFVIATLSGTFETVGDAIAVQKVSQRNFRRIDYESVRGSLNADAVGNALAGIMCTTPNTTYSSPTGMIPIIGVGSRWVALYGAGLMVVMAFFPVLTGFVLDLPLAAIGRGDLRYDAGPLCDGLAAPRSRAGSMGARR